MKLESAQQRRPEDDSRQDSDGLDRNGNLNRYGTDTPTRPRLPDPPDPDNLPIDYPALREIEWP